MLLGAERFKKIALVSCDQGAWVRRAVGEHCPNAIVCMDPFHVTRMASDALDVVRREVWNEARRRKDAAGARWLKGARCALWKAPERLTERQRDKLAQIQQTNRSLYRAYLLKEHLRAVFHQDTPEAAIGLLDAWTSWARRSRIGSFVKLARTIRRDRQAIVPTLVHRLSNARMEAANTTIRLITRRAYGFHSRGAHRLGHARTRRPLSAPSWPPVTDRPTEATGAPEIATALAPPSGRMRLRPARGAPVQRHPAAHGNLERMSRSSKGPLPRRRSPSRSGVTPVRHGSCPQRRKPRVPQGFR
jgi:hypothetical protein